MSSSDQPTASLSRGIQVRSGYGSGTKERPNGTGCVQLQERAATASRTEAARYDRTYDCCTPVSLCRIEHGLQTIHQTPCDAVECESRQNQRGYEVQSHQWPITSEFSVLHPIKNAH